MPDRWNLLLKKRGSKKCENYRGIALVDLAYKVVAVLIKERMQLEMENIMGNY